MRPGFPTALLALVMLTIPAVALSDGRFPGEQPSRSAIKSQSKADQLFEAGNYERALFIYKNDLAPIGDKYAQYMIGYMHLAGQGVAEDPITASAWYRLAAERGHESFLKASEALYETFNDRQRELSDQAFMELRKQYGDIWIVGRMLESDLDTLANRDPLHAAVEPSNRHNVASDDRSDSFYDHVAHRVAKRSGYLETLLRNDKWIEGPDRARFEALLQRTRQAVDSYSRD